MNKIIESHFILGQDSKLTNLIIEAFGSNWDEKDLGQNGHIVFLDIEPIQTIISSISSSSEPKLEKPSFSDYLKKIDYSNFDNLLLLVSTYSWGDYEEILKKVNNTFGFENKHLDMVLKETNGLLIYSYQLENLFIMATGSDMEQAVTFRKDINKKKAITFEESKKMKLFGTTLHAIMEDRMPLIGTRYGRYSETYKLYQYLNL